MHFTAIFQTLLVLLPALVSASVVNDPWLESKFPRALQPQSTCRLKANYPRFNIMINTASCGKEPLKVSPRPAQGEDPDCIYHSVLDASHVISLPVNSETTFSVSKSERHTSGRRFTIVSDKDSSVLINLELCPDGGERSQASTCELPIFSMGLGGDGSGAAGWGGASDGVGWSCPESLCCVDEKTLYRARTTLSDKLVYTGQPLFSYPPIVEIDYCAPSYADVKTWC